MNFGTNLFIIFWVLYLKGLFTKIFSTTKRVEHQDTRAQITTLRNKPGKTLEDQKKFLDLKYPKTPPKKMTFTRVFKFILKLATMITVFYVVRAGWVKFINVEIPLWVTITTLIIIPVIINFALKKFGLEDDDFTIFFK